MVEQRRVPFSKYHGLGNDFIVVLADDLPEDIARDRAVAMCDRHRGIGADGLLWLRGEDETAFRIRIFNADGSVPETCGNGIRCAVRFWLSRFGVGEGTLTVQSDAGVGVATLFSDSTVEVDMGPALFSGPNLPPLEHLMVGFPTPPLPPEILGIPVSMGNPHLVIFHDDWRGLNRVDAARLEHHPGFPQRANVNFARVSGPGEIELSVWERGVGFTQACGSGACATAAAALKFGFVSEQQVKVTLPGGALTISVAPDFSRLLMRGPAEPVFSGEIDLS
ncbi:MAG: diaminopimelate epimerase [Myxococcales bacterium]|nr:diaminopimelate epimerase [Myxococcales bacterium]